MHLPNIHATAAVAMALALLLTALSLQVSRLRLRYRQTWGDGGHRDLIVAIRTHGNTLEQAMLFIVLLLLTQLAGQRQEVVAVLGCVFVAARLLYAIAAGLRRLPLRQLAHAVSVICQLCAVAALGHAVITSLVRAA